jgi:hypothetical protein
MLRLMASAGALALVSPAFAGIINGDFEAGNTGFTNDYAYRVVSDPPNSGQYGVTTSSFAWTQFWHTLPGDHTTGSGQFLIVDVGGPATAALWRQTVSVAPNTDYTLSAWLATWTTFAPASVSVAVNGVSIANWTAPTGATWTQYTANWNSGASTSVTLSITPTSFFQPGDDVAFDDIMLVPAPGAAAALGLGMLALRRRR